jgi:hypothetical protein
MGETVVSRKVITLLFLIGSCFYIPGIVMIIWGYVDLLQTSIPAVSSSTSSLSGLGTFMGFLLAGAVIGIIGSIFLLVARIGALIEAAKAQEWVWFVLMVILGWIVLLIYLIAAPKPNPALHYVAYPSWPGYPPHIAGTVPPPAQPWPANQPPKEQQDAPDMPQE